MDLVRRSEASTSRVIKKLVSLLVEEARLIRGVDKSEVESLKYYLENIRYSLRTPHASLLEEEELSDAMKDWLKQSEEVTELIEDIVDEYVLKASQRPQQRGFISFIGRAGRLIGALNNHHKSSLDTRNIKALLLQILLPGERFNIRNRAYQNRTAVADRYHDLLLIPHSLESTVGIDSTANELIQRLVEGASERSVVSLVGIGGIGKTTLAKKVYNSDVVRGHFDCLAWITVTQSYKMKDLLRIMVRQIGVAEDQYWRMGELIITLRQYLESKRYLFIFDDVWKHNVWDDVEYALIKNELGSRIIITTRSDAVANHCKLSSLVHVHRLEPLSEEVSWELFCSRAFPHEHERCCPLHLEQLSLEIIRMCQGLPLAIVALAGLLSTKERTVFEWRRLLDDFQFQLKSDPHLSNVFKILALSFHDLPHQLKMCFFYFSIFPKDSLIPNDKLFKLWIAEGFVEASESMTLEEVAEGYLNELIQRNLVQVCEGFYGLEKLCRVHVFLLEIARQKADEFSLCQTRDGGNSSFRGKSRRLSISNNIDDNVLETIDDSQVRSVFLSNLDALNDSFVISLFEKYKLLTLIDFENVRIHHLPEEVGNLFHLKYLSLKNTKVKRLPKSVGKLQNLETLDLRQTLLVELPIEINMLRNLRHLLASSYDDNISLDSTRGVRIKEGIGYLENLQTLMTVEANLSGIVIIKELKKLRQLRRLGISRLTRELATALCTCITEMIQLESLSLHSRNEYEIFDFQNISSTPLLLQRLILKGRLQSLPNWIARLQNLSMLCLSLSSLADDPLRHISDLPHLVSLWLYRAYEGEQLHFIAGGFQKLKLLVLRDLQGLEMVEIEEGALPLLEELRIGPSPFLNEVPSGIQHLRSLKVLAFYDMPDEMVLSMQPDGGSDYVKVEHVPSVLFWYRIQGRSYALYELGESDLLDRLQGAATNFNGVVRHDLQLSFSYSDDEAGSASSSNLTGPWNDKRFSFARDRMSFSSDRFSFFSDDIED